jgi:hypothetical protein
MRFRKHNHLLIILLIIPLIFLLASSFTQPIKALDDVVILSHSGYLDSSDYYHVVGEVKNIGEQAVNLVQLTATFYQSDDTLITDRIALTMLNTILVDRKSPFDITLLDLIESSKVHHYTITLTYSNTTTDSEGLEILSHNSQQNNSGYFITGEIKNIGNEKAQNVKVIATYYNNGNVVAANITLLDPIHSDLEPNQTLPFTISMTDGNIISHIESYELTAGSLQYAIKLEPPTDEPTPTPTEPTPTPTDEIPEFSTILPFFLAFAFVIIFQFILKKHKVSNTLR